MFLILNFGNSSIIEQVPLLRHGILAKSRVVTSAQAPNVVAHSIQAVGCSYLALSGLFLTIIRHIKVFYGKIYCFCYFSRLICSLMRKPFEMNDQILW